MTDSNDKFNKPGNGLNEESELDAELLAAAQKWAEEFNPEWTEDHTGDSIKTNAKSKVKAKARVKKAAEVLVDGDLKETKGEINTKVGFDGAEQLIGEKELFDSDSNTANPYEDKRNEIYDIHMVEEQAAAESAKSETQISPSLEEDDRQGLMRWDEAINLEAQVEAILFAAPKPISISEIAEVLSDDDGMEPQHYAIEGIVQQLLRLYKERSGGFRLEYDKGAGYQFRTVPAAAPIMERMFSSRQRPLSRAAHETLAIIAYRQPCTRADIEFIRGVDAGSIIKNLLERDLVACVGRKEDSGRPMLFGTTVEFMRVFRIQSLNDLPPLSAFQPASDAIMEAFHKIEQPEYDVEIEGFIGDPARQYPEISADVSRDFAKSDSVFEVIEDGSESTAPVKSEIRRSGGIFDNEGFLSDGHENTEMAFPVRDRLEEGSRKDASRGPDQHQRKSGPRTGDKDPS